MSSFQWISKYNFPIRKQSMPPIETLPNVAVLLRKLNKVKIQAHQQ